jgi:site-specific DNA-methyltransferase (adenine-specific)
VPRRSTATSSFGSGKRESHDATGFYRRFPAPEVAADDLGHAPAVVDELFCADARAMDSTQVADGSVALVVNASRVGHPAPFPLALPQRLIELYTDQGDLVLDPFIGSGTTALAARMFGRHYVGFDVDPAYLELARTRLAQADGVIPTPEQALAASTPPDGTS